MPKFVGAREGTAGERAERREQDRRLGECCVHAFHAHVVDELHFHARAVGEIVHAQGRPEIVAVLLAHLKRLFDRLLRELCARTGGHDFVSWPRIDAKIESRRSRSFGFSF